MFKDKKNVYYLTLIPLGIILILFIWLFTVIFEGEKPRIALDPLPDYISGKQSFKIKISDLKRGLKTLLVSYSQGGRDIKVVEIKFPFEGLLNRQGLHQFEKDFDIDPSKLHLAQGRLDLNIQVWDYSRRGGGDGNMTLLQHKMTVDTIPPAIMSVSKMHNINIGGSGLVIYRPSSDTAESGVFVDDIFFPGFTAVEDSKEGLFLAYFALPHNSGINPSIYLWAKDKAGNITNSTFYYHIRMKRFRNDEINISDNFLKRVLPYFSFYDFDPGMSDKEKYIKINTELRKADNEKLKDLMKRTTPKKLWEGSWLRMKNAATMARFGDHRIYYYNGEKIDEQFHLGVDLASLANSPVRAGNSGNIIFAERNGIYGLTVIIDHGQGLASLYGHLSAIQVTVGDEVKKGDLIGNSGQTGLAGGDHLHFSILVHGIFVNPVEWWDDHWIMDNITRKLDLITTAGKPKSP